MLSFGYLAFWDELPMPVRWVVYTLFMGYLIYKRRAQHPNDDDDDEDSDNDD